MIPRARSLSRKHTVAATGAASRVSQPSGAPARHSPASVLEAGDAAGGDRLDRAGGDEVDADPARAEVAREVARDALERRLRDAHPVIYRPGDAGVEVEAHDRAAVLAASSSGASAAASAFSENALVSNAVIALLAGVSRKPPPSASAGANAIACSTPSSAAPARPQLLGDARRGPPAR